MEIMLGKARTPAAIVADPMAVGLLGWVGQSSCQS